MGFVPIQQGGKFADPAKRMSSDLQVWFCLCMLISLPIMVQFSPEGQTRSIKTAI